MCSEIVNKPDLTFIKFCAALIFAQQKCKKNSSVKQAFFMHFGVTKQVLEERIWFYIKHKNFQTLLVSDLHNSAHEYY